MSHRPTYIQARAFQQERDEIEAAKVGQRGCSCRELLGHACVLYHTTCMQCQIGVYSQQIEQNQAGRPETRAWGWGWIDRNKKVGARSVQSTISSDMRAEGPSNARGRPAGVHLHGIVVRTRARRPEQHTTTTSMAINIGGARIQNGVSPCMHMCIHTRAAALLWADRKRILFLLSCRPGIKTHIMLCYTYIYVHVTATYQQVVQYVSCMHTTYGPD